MLDRYLCSGHAADDEETPRVWARAGARGVVTRQDDQFKQTISVRRVGRRACLIESVGVGVLAVLALAARAPFTLSHLWAEDGAVFLQQAVTRGVLSPFGQAYAGYYNFVPRTIAVVASMFPLHWAATTTWAGTATVVGWCAATITYESHEWLHDPAARILLGLSIVLLPALGAEAIATSSELQYTLLFTSLAALMGSGTTRGSEVNRVAIVVVTALSTPLTLLLAPFAALRILARRPRRIDVTAAAWTIATAMQFGAILIEHPPRNVGTPGKRIVSQYQQQVLYANLLPKQLAHSSAARYLALIGACLVVLAVTSAWRQSRRSTAVFILLVPTIGFGSWTFAGINYGLPPRYRVFPALCLVWSVLVASNELGRRLRTALPIGRLIPGLATVVLVLTFATYWQPPRHRSSGPTWSSSLATAQHRCRQQGRPSAAIAISPKGWKVTLPCHDIE